MSVGGLRAGEEVDYLERVKPVLAARCYACHGGLQQKSGLRLDTVSLMKKGGKSGPVVVPGSAAASELVRRITGAGGARRMPPPSEGEALRPDEISLIRAWIDQGAKGPDEEQPEADPNSHWAFRPPVRPALPRVTQEPGSARNPIDAFIAAGREKRGLPAQGPADRLLLLRRVYLDLVGLPPTPAQQAAFLADTSPDAYEKVVDRLLGSAQYGERWGRHWMDVWRYSDWWGLGAEVRNSQKHIWHWRDWIIESLNEDRGYDQMVREMLAADELYPDDLDRLRATGYLARSYFKFNRDTWLEGVVEHTSKGLLGLTLNCAKCHEHKYDPFPQEAYYQLRAFFEPYQIRTDLVPGEVSPEKDGIPRAFDCNLDAPTYLYVRGDDKQPDRSRKIEPGLPAVLVRGPLKITPIPLPAEAHTPGLRPHVLASHLEAAEKRISAAREALEQARQVLARAGREPKEPVPPKADTPAKPAPHLVQDDFARPRPELWEMRAGTWKHEGGRLVQEQVGATRAVLRLKQAVPADFRARAAFRILGGEKWMSVGLTFDAADGGEVLVYLSAVAGGSKVQVSYKQGETHVYPPGAMQARPVKVGEAQRLDIQVRGTLVNVAVGGEPAVAYRLPVPRRPGSVELVTFDARAEFQAFELASLPPEARLVEAGPPAKAAAEQPPSAEAARLAVAHAEKALAAALLQPGVLQARAAADRAAHQAPPPGARELARQAARAEREAALAEAEEKLALAELELARAPANKKAEAEKKLAAARGPLAAARKALDAASESYTPLRGALKTLESNVESEASRMKPFPRTSTGRRAALARWMTGRDNPLTARVAVNHIWMRHMGQPLVATVFDFGRKGASPSHPELLDWLACEFMDGGWSMKALHRLIVTSQTYRMTSSSAGAAPACLEGDQENRWYWRMNPVRLDAQVLRDSMLHLAGDLDLTQGGPSVPITAETARRSLYHVHSHNDQHKLLAIFDDANVLECYRRAESIVPQQALALANSRLALTTAEKVARRLSEAPAGRSDADFLRSAFTTVLGCEPDARELELCTRVLGELKAVARREKRPDPALRARTRMVHALLNHNDFITIR